MADLVPQSALAEAYAPGHFGASDPGREPRLTVCERRPLAMVQVAVSGGDAQAVGTRLAKVLGIDGAPEPNRTVAVGQRRIHWVGPGRWLVVEPRTSDLFRDLRSKAPPTEAAVVDLGHARTCLRLAGVDARAVLAKGCVLDFHPRIRQEGDCAQSLAFGVPALIDVVATGTAVDLYVPRSLAASFWEALGLAAAEFGYLVQEPNVR